MNEKNAGRCAGEFEEITSDRMPEGMEPMPVPEWLREQLLQRPKMVTKTICFEIF